MDNNIYYILYNIYWAMTLGTDGFNIKKKKIFKGDRRKLAFCMV